MHEKLKHNSVQLETWFSQEVLDQVRMVDQLVIIPLGSFEQHGLHSPLGTDTFISWEVCQRLARNLNGVTVPPIWFSVSEEHMDFAGTITISPGTFCNYMSDIILSLARGGFTKIIIINGHGSNETYFPVIQDIVAKRFKGKLDLLLLSYWSALPANEKEYLCSLKWGLHANEFETSLSLAIFPDLIKSLTNNSYFPDVNGLGIESIDATLFRTLIKGSTGIWGDPSKASIKKGQTLLASIESTLSRYVATTFKLSMSE